MVSILVVDNYDSFVFNIVQYLQQLGAEVTTLRNDAVTGGDLAARLGRSRRAVKAALLDQRAVAGIGNIYAAEILHRAGIDPRSPCRRLEAADTSQGNVGFRSRMFSSFASLPAAGA